MMTKHNSKLLRTVQIGIDTTLGYVTALGAAMGSGNEMDTNPKARRPQPDLSVLTN